MHWLLRIHVHEGGVDLSKVLGGQVKALGARGYDLMLAIAFAMQLACH